MNTPAFFGPGALDVARYKEYLRALQGMDGGVLDQIARKAPELMSDIDAASATAEALNVEMDDLAAVLSLANALAQRSELTGVAVTEAVSEIRQITEYEQLAEKLQVFVDGLRDNTDAVNLERRRAIAERSGIHQLVAVEALCDLRAVFCASVPPLSEELTEDSSMVAELLPLAILEVSAELNEERVTHAYQLDVHSLKRLIRVLEATVARLDSLSAMAETIGGEAGNG